MDESEKSLTPLHPNHVKLLRLKAGIVAAEMQTSGLARSKARAPSGAPLMTARIGGGEPGAARLDAREAGGPGQLPG